MALSQDFASDFDVMSSGLHRNYQGGPYAFVRFGDGEAAIINGNKYQTKADGWSYPGGDSRLRQVLTRALRCQHELWNIGLPCPCHEPWFHAPLANLSQVPIEQRTYAKLFVDSNYSRWRSLDLSHCCVIAASGATSRHFTVPENGTHPLWPDWERLVERMLRVRQPIIVSAGPLAKVIIYYYWAAQCDTKRQVIIDVGSAIDESHRGRNVRLHSHEPHTGKWMEKRRADEFRHLREWKP